MSYQDLAVIVAGLFIAAVVVAVVVWMTVIL